MSDDTLLIYVRGTGVEFSKDDDVWNASAQRLPVAAFGETLERAVENVKSSIDGHLEAIGKDSADELLFSHKGKAVIRTTVYDEPDGPMMEIRVHEPSEEEEEAFEAREALIRLPVEEARKFAYQILKTLDDSENYQAPPSPA